uniref:HDC02732 n=1 Tax=Drosophila melanogaster TaxID=7227 RepID=Q6IHD1_DROME|nr:TPA_inf: HDC02732 [Drosophila melanogaster]
MSKLFRLDERTRTYKVPGGGRDGVEERVCDKLERTPNRIGVGGTCNTCHTKNHINCCTQPFRLQIVEGGDSAGEGGFGGGEVLWAENVDYLGSSLVEFSQGVRRN